MNARLRIRPYRRGDMEALAARHQLDLPPAAGELAEWSWWAFSAERRDVGLVVASAGLARVDPWRCWAWAAFSPLLSPRDIAAIRRRMRIVLGFAAAEGVHCIEAEAPLDFAAGCRFLAGLGFAPAGVARGRMPPRHPGDTAAAFARFVRATAPAPPLPTSIAAALDFTGRVIAAWQRRPRDAAPSILKAA